MWRRKDGKEQEKEDISGEEGRIMSLHQIAIYVQKYRNIFITRYDIRRIRQISIYNRENINKNRIYE